MRVVPRNKEILPRKPLADLLRTAGAPRVSKEGAEAFGQVLTQFADEIAKHAAELAAHSGRRTVLGEDVKLAADTLLKRQTLQGNAGR